MKLRFLGAAGTVTGSRYLLDTGEKKILVDCGLFQGYKPLRLRNWAAFPIAPGEIDAAVLTHAHLDHSGYLPLLVKSGFAGRILCTPATRDLCKILLRDSGHLQEKEAEYANRRGFSKHRPALPLAGPAVSHRSLESIEADSSDAAGISRQSDGDRSEPHLPRASARPPLTREECDRTFALAIYVRDIQESKALNSNPVPKVIISASGMATGGRVLHHLKNPASDQRNTLLFSGFQAGGTRGAAIVNGAETVKIHGMQVPIRAEVDNLDMLSAHADADEILAWLRAFERAPKMTFITHGEPAAADALRMRIQDELGWRCSTPEHLEAVTL